MDRSGLSSREDHDWLRGRSLHLVPIAILGLPLSHVDLPSRGITEEADHIIDVVDLPHASVNLRDGRSPLAVNPRASCGSSFLPQPQLEEVTIGQAQPNECGSVSLSSDTASRTVEAQHDRLIKRDLTVTVHDSVDLVMLKPGIRGRDNLIEEVSSSVSLFLIGVHDRISQDLYILMPGLTGRHMNRATSGITGRIAVGLPQGFDQLVVILDIM